MTLQEWKKREEYKTAKHIKIVDIDGNELPNSKWFSNVIVLLRDYLPDGSLLFKLWVYNSLPDGWKTRIGATTAPNGFRWIYNGKSVFSSEYRRALLRIQ